MKLWNTKYAEMVGYSAVILGCLAFVACELWIFLWAIKQIITILG